MAISGSDQSQLYAMCGVARCGATRCGDHSAIAFVTVDGVLRQSDADGKILRQDDIRISEQASQGANLAQLTGLLFTPTEGQEVVITLGSVNNGDPIFAGRVSRRTTNQVGKDALVFTSLNAVDYTFDANQRLVTKRWTNTSATDIATEGISLFAPQMSPAGIVAGLPTLDEFTVTNETFTGFMQRLADRIGGYFTISYRKDSGKPIVRLFLTTSGTNPTDLSNTHPTMNNFKYSADLSSVVTRCYVEGQGSTTSTDVAAGSTVLPLVTASVFDPAGGMVTCGPQGRVTYSGIASLAAPSAPSGSASAGGLVDIGTHTYKTTFISSSGETLGSSASSAVTVAAVSAPGACSAAEKSPKVTGALAVGSYSYKISYATAAGETLVGASASATVSAVGAPGSCSLSGTTGGSMTSNSPYAYVISFVTASGEVASSSYSTVSTGVGDTAVSMTAIPTSGDARVTARKVYRSGAGFAGDYRLVTTIGNNSATTYTDTTADSSLGAIMPVGDTASTGQISLTSIPTSGDARVTARVIYRTAVGGSVYKRLTTISDNTTTTLTDNAADSSLGADAPLTSTSGGSKVTVTGIATSSDPRVTARRIYRTVAGGTDYRLVGTIGDNVTTSFVDNSADALLAPAQALPTIGTIVGLTGIPASGAGSITDAIAAGTDVNLVVQCDDAAAQTALAALVGGDGVREAYAPDRRLSFTEATARGTALLQSRSAAQVTVTYTSRDKNTRVGQDITVSVGDISGTFKIQSVQIHTFSVAGSRSSDPLGVDLFPTYDVTASNQRYSLEDLLRQLKSGAS